MRTGSVATMDSTRPFISAECRLATSGDLYYRQQVLGARVGYVLVRRLALRILRRFLNDDDGIGLETLEAAP